MIQIFVIWLVFWIFCLFSGAAIFALFDLVVPSVSTGRRVSVRSGISDLSTVGMLSIYISALIWSIFSGVDERFVFAFFTSIFFIIINIFSNMKTILYEAVKRVTHPALFLVSISLFGLSIAYFSSFPERG